MRRRIHPHRISVTSLSCHPRPRRRDRGSFSPPSSFPPSHPLYPFFLHVILRILRAKMRLCRKFHPRIAQLIPRSFSCQLASQRDDNPRCRCVLSKLDTYRSIPVHPLVSTDLFLLPSLFFPSLER